ncbi:hypothetical protein B0H14DRAFT_2836191 [Mycena olivaceomarginata]|nr:hypothetical protein B0H14DRAFT_2836191 [Mycena olivaceomarginata]
MRSTTLVLCAAASLAAAAPRLQRRDEIQCAPADKNGVPFTSSAPSEDDPTSDCPQGVAQDPSVTTDAPSTAGADPTDPASDPASDPVSTPAASDPASDSASDPVSTPAASDPVSTPAVSTPAVSSKPAVSTPAASKSSAVGGAPASQSVPAPSPSPSTGGARALSASFVGVVAAVGLGMLL